MRMFMIAAVLTAGTALAGTSAMAGSSDNWRALPSSATCGQMKMRVLAVQGAPNSAPIIEGSTGKPNPNESGSTERTTIARHEIAAGDAACSKGNVAMGREHYQNAINELTASR